MKEAGGAGIEAGTAKASWISSSELAFPQPFAATPSGYLRHRGDHKVVDAGTGGQVSGKPWNGVGEGNMAFGGCGPG